MKIFKNLILNTRNLYSKSIIKNIHKKMDEVAKAQVNILFEIDNIIFFNKAQYFDFKNSQIYLFKIPMIQKILIVYLFKINKSF